VSANLKRVILCVVAVGLGVGSGYVIGTKTSVEPLIPRPDANESEGFPEGDWADENWQKWEEAVQTNIKGRREIVEALVEIGKDETRNGEARIFAITLIGRMNSQEAIESLLANTTLWVGMAHKDSDDAVYKQQPCFYALKSMGWQVVPHALEVVEGKRSAQELQMLAALFEHICGSKVASVILEERMNKLLGNPAKAQGIANIKAMLSHMKAVPKAPG
jgi:hypothetical protein